MKYSTFDCSKCDVVYREGEYTVYYHTTIGRRYLVRDGKRLAEMIKKPEHDTIEYWQKWIKKWKTNAANQVGSLESRIRQLKSEQQEIIEMMK